jgi:DNA-binding response OmpR family regulator
MRIILIEPDKILADIYRRALQSAGHAVVICAGAQSAIYAADEAKPEFVITELQLIGHSGMEFLYEFRSYQDWQAIPVLVHTSVPAGEFMDNWGVLRDELGIQGYLYKPQTSLEALLATVAELSEVPA